MKINCIVDTCTYVNLSEVTYSKGTVLDLLHKELKVSFSSVVNGEIRRHYRSSMPSYLSRGKYVITPNKFPLRTYQTKMFGGVYLANTNNAGEKDNFIISYDQACHIKCLGVVYLSDDERAKRGVLKDWLSAIPSVLSWKSHDLIVYLYTTDKLTKDLALGLLRDVDAQVYPYSHSDSPETRAKNMTEKQRRMVEYQNKIEIISKIYN